MSQVMKFKAGPNDKPAMPKSVVHAGLYQVSVKSVKPSSSNPENPIVNFDILDDKGRAIGRMFNVYSYRDEVKETESVLDKESNQYIDVRRSDEDINRDQALVAAQWEDFLALAYACGINLDEEFTSDQLVGRTCQAGVNEIEWIDRDTRAHRRSNATCHGCYWLSDDRNIEWTPPERKGAHASYRR